MRVHRRLLYTGMFLIALGGVLVAADLRAIDTATVRDALRLWPLAVILLGVGIVARRSPAAVPTGMLAAGVPGLLLGGAIAIGPRFIADCDAPVAGSAAVVRQGSFDGPASVSIRGGCGVISLSTAPGTGWQVTATSASDATPVIEATGRSLEIAALGAGDWTKFDRNRAGWELTLPTSEISELSYTVTASDSHVDLAGARVRSLDVTANASQLKIDLSDATVGAISAIANGSELSIELPGASDLTGNLRATAGSLRICAPAGLGLRVTGRDFAGHVAVDGAHVGDGTYESVGYATAAHHADLRVNATFGSIEINPIGGCK